jgi:hypothetical protein
MSNEIIFLPLLRRGFAQALAAPDPLGGSLAREPTIDAWVSVAGERAEQALGLRSADEVLAIGASQILREEPSADTTDAEPNYFPFVELAAADLPWAYTPAAPAGKGRLRPWLVLVVVREQDGVTVTRRPGTTPSSLRFEPPAAPENELPDLAESWAWAHVQSLVPLEQVETAVADGTGDVIARLLCPRRLVPNAAYRACVVGAFSASGDSLQPAWDLTKLHAPFELSVYHQWRFTTGTAGDFEALCRQLAPDAAGATIGFHALDVTNPGLVSAAKTTILVDYEGTLRSSGAVPRKWDPKYRRTFQKEIGALLRVGAARADVTPPRGGEPYDPQTQDPVVAPPLYGLWPAGVMSVPATGWARQVNDHPAKRAAAGLGARLVRENQEALVATAWDAAGQLRATTAALNQARLAAEIGRSWTRRASALADADLLQLTARQHAFLPADGASVRARLTVSAVPNGLISATYLRQTRQSTSLARDFTRRAGTRLGQVHVETTLKATREPKLAAAISFATFDAPHGLVRDDPTLEVQPPARTFAVEQKSRSADDVSGIAGVVRQALDPVGAARSNLLQRVPALAEVVPSASLPTSMAVGPSFDQPLCWDLLRLGSSWLLPGVDRLSRNRVVLVETNAASVGSLLIGANNELARELLWRGYPVDLRATFFHRFWNYVDSARDDITDLRGWTLTDSIEENMGGHAATMTVIVVRGELVRRYPTAHWYLQQARLDADGRAQALAGSVREATFFGSLERDTLFVGFDGVTPDEVRGDRTNGKAGWFIAVEEQPGAPRFGLDEAGPDDFGATPGSWSDLSWGHLVRSRRALDALTHAPAAAPRWLRGVSPDVASWGRNSAHLARITWQQPFRMFIHADQLI